MLQVQHWCTACCSCAFPCWKDTSVHCGVGLESLPPAFQLLLCDSSSLHSQQCVLCQPCFVSIATHTHTNLFKFQHCVFCVRIREIPKNQLIMHSRLVDFGTATCRWELLGPTLMTCTESSGQYRILGFGGVLNVQIAQTGDRDRSHLLLS